ncbi:hypothetical protein SAY86_012811 [Trapa natans]|uniref:Uncharacterized protein n=1 Tax=Trapa natans TaxID=22666 RepID=A0AAN7LYI5_TRANT|nr:hypothetical protein SAY86_012811 [Trapa natans]
MLACLASPLLAGPSAQLQTLPGKKMNHLPRNLWIHERFKSSSNQNIGKGDEQQQKLCNKKIDEEPRKLTVSDWIRTEERQSQLVYYNIETTKDLCLTLSRTHKAAATAAASALHVPTFGSWGSIAQPWCSIAALSLGHYPRCLACSLDLEGSEVRPGPYNGTKAEAQTLDLQTGHRGVSGS